MMSLFKSVLLLSALFVTACSGSTSQSAQGASAKVEAQVQADVIRVLCFYGKQRCYTCRAIETLSKQVVDSLGNAKIVWQDVDITKPENQALADKYQVTWSSLVLERGNQSVNLTNEAFRLAKTQPEAFKAMLLQQINEMQR